MARGSRRDGEGRRGNQLPVMQLAPWHDVVERAILQHRHKPGPLLQILHDINAALRHVPPDCVPVLADALNLSRADVHGVVSFYHDFRNTPAGKHTLKICRAESCQALGANQLLEYAKARMGVELHGTTRDGEVTLEPVYCLGNCALSPAVMLDDRVFGRVSEARLDGILTQALKSGGSK